MSLLGGGGGGLFSTLRHIKQIIISAPFFLTCLQNASQASLIPQERFVPPPIPSPKGDKPKN